MKYSIVFKFLAFLLATLSLFAVLGSAVGIVTLAAMDLYDQSVDKLYEEEMAELRRDLAVNIAHRYASLELGSIPEAYLRTYHSNQWQYSTFRYGEYFYVIRNEKGEAVENTLPEGMPGLTRFEITVTSINYRALVQSLTQENTDPTGETAEAVPGSLLEPQLYQDGYYDPQTGQVVELIYVLETLPPYTVELYLTADALPVDPLWSLLKSLWQLRYSLFYSLGIGLLVFAAAAVYLCCAAGRKPKSDALRPGALNRIPLDLYTGLVVLAGIGCAFLAPLGVELLARHSPGLMLPFLFFSGTGVSLMLVAYGYAWVAQIKAPGGFWWRHSILGFAAIRLWRGIKWVGRGCKKLMALLPVVWQWLVTAFGAAALVVLTFCAMIFSHDASQPFWALLFLLSLAGSIALVCYGAYCFGVLIKGAQHMAQGNLSWKIPTNYLRGSFLELAEQLNSLAGAALIAAQRQMHSERMKTELITNVSHDIKTPLTSIINYVDLLQKPHTEDEGKQYLEVLDRQSQRLKKLVEDLMEMSKASSGNISVELSRMDAAETLNQALGEFSDKLARAELTPLMRLPQEPVFMLADGRLVWRVLSNLLGNAVKYAMPNTRLYLDVETAEDHVVISIKNISREELNLRADELLERFVRGDLSRNTEGSGLGLNIAQSLMELQHGSLKLTIDGDLFKVTLQFPKA